MTKTRNHVDDLRGATRLAVEATTGVTDLVQAMHVTIGGGPLGLFAWPVRIATAPVYWSIRTVAKIVGVTLDGALGQLSPLLGKGAPGPEREAVLAALNGVLGDYLSETKNPLAIEMRLHHEVSEGSKLLVMVHGSGMNHLQWLRHGHSHATIPGYVPILLHYNSGLHVSTNGRAFDLLLRDLVREWTTPIDEIAIVGHSMGGLVARSACHYGGDEPWLRKLRTLITIGTPHHGAPLERIGNWVGPLLGISRYSAPFARLGKIRSAGITDLRFGNVLDEDWEGVDRFDLGKDRRTPVMLPDGVRCFAVAGSKSSTESALGDGMVPIASALGRHERADLALKFSDSHIAFATDHLGLLSSMEVYEKVAHWLE